MFCRHWPINETSAGMNSNPAWLALRRREVWCRSEPSALKEPS
jgi:hypothetical protein